MALHRGRIDLLEEHLQRDPGLLRRTFTHAEIYPPELGCHDEPQALHGTPLAGATLLHLCVEYDEMEIARWLLERGMDVDARAAVDADGFGGPTALFGAVVSYPNFMGNFRGELPDAPFARLLLDRGADPNARASLRKQLTTGEDQTLREYRDIGKATRLDDRIDFRGDRKNAKRHHAFSLSIIGCVMRQMPSGVIRNRFASSSGSSPTTKPSGI